MATSSSSTKKAARLAQKGKGQKVRFQGGTLFPLAVALVLVLGMALVVYARQSRPAFGDSQPAVSDHWHHVYGFYLCDTWFQLDGDGEGRDANDNPTNIEYARTGVHSHSDGLIHWHPFTSLAVGSRAKLGLFLKTYGADLDNDKLEFSPDQRVGLPYQQETGVFEDGETECEIKDDEGNVTGTETGELKAVVWDNISDTGDGRTLTAAFDDIRLDKDAMIVAIAFVPDDEDIPKPPWTTTFDEAVTNDTNQQQADQLFPNVEVTEDGDVLNPDGEQVNQDDVGPAVEDRDPEPASTEVTAADDGGDESDS